MKSAFNKNSSGQDIVNFLSTTFTNAQNYQDALETVAIALLPLLRQSRPNLDAKARNVPAFYDMVTEDLDYDAMSRKVRSLTPVAIQQFLGENGKDKKDGPLKQARQIKSQITSMSVEDYVAMTEAFDSVLPPSIKAASDAMNPGEDSATEAREIHALAASLSVDDIAAAIAERDKQIPPEKQAAGIHSLLQQCTPERLESLVTYLNDNLGGAALGLLVKRFWEFAEETLTAAEKGDFMHPANPAKAKGFGRALHDTLTTLDEGLSHAGFVLPPELSNFLALQFNTGKMLRSAVASNQGAAVKKGIDGEMTVGKPLQFKKPGFEL